MYDRGTFVRGNARQVVPRVLHRLLILRNWPINLGARSSSTHLSLRYVYCHSLRLCPAARHGTLMATFFVIRRFDSCLKKEKKKEKNEEIFTHRATRVFHVSTKPTSSSCNFHISCRASLAVWIFIKQELWRLTFVRSFWTQIGKELTSTCEKVNICNLQLLLSKTSEIFISSCAFCDFCTNRDLILSGFV